jgi:uncharacterized protein YjiS (DUF1127 family)
MAQATCLSMNRTDMTLQHAGYARLEHVASTLWNVWLAARRAWNAEHARNDLRLLSDRTLKDIGLSRGQIDSLFR